VYIAQVVCQHGQVRRHRVAALDLLEGQAVLVIDGH
jgi:hypothetical protein